METNEMKRLLCSWVSRLNVVKRAILSKVNHIFNIILIKIHRAHFVKMEKKIERGLKKKTTLKEKKQSYRTPTTYFKTYYKVTVIKTVTTIRIIE